MRYDWVLIRAGKECGCGGGGYGLCREGWWTYEIWDLQTGQCVRKCGQKGMYFHSDTIQGAIVSAGMSCINMEKCATTGV